MTQYKTFSRFGSDVIWTYTSLDAAIKDVMTRRDPFQTERPCFQGGR